MSNFIKIKVVDFKATEDGAPDIDVYVNIDQITSFEAFTGILNGRSVVDGAVIFVSPGRLQGPLICTENVEIIKDYIEAMQALC
jgi:hypothetical protein